MKHPDELRDRLAKQWMNPDVRERRLLTPADRPLDLTIGRPPSAILVNNPAAFRRHLQSWQMVEVSGIGSVISEEINYRDSSQPISVPKVWRLENPSEWIKACNNPDIESEFDHLGQIIEQVDSCFFRTVVRQKKKILSKSIEEVVLTAKVAMVLEADCADGQPLRALSVEGCDSKFFERNRWLVTQFLTDRLKVNVAEIGLEKFLGALKDSDHWLLVVPLQEGLLPFEQLRVRAGELKETALAASNILLVENEKSVYQLPELPDTVAILGAGQNLSWLAAEWLKEKNIAYWGDLDTWGLDMLSTARQHLPQLTALMMEQNVFDCYAKDRAVVEPVSAGETPPAGLTGSEADLYRYLHCKEKGRLEQEFLPREYTTQCIEKWLDEMGTG